MFLNSGTLGVWAESVLYQEDLHLPTVARRMFTILGLNMSEDPLRTEGVPPCIAGSFPAGNPTVAPHNGNEGNRE